MALPEVILGLDPGGTTGWCRWHRDKDDYNLVQFDTALADPEKIRLFVKYLRCQYAWNDTLDVVCEIFEYRQEDSMGRTKIDYTPAKVEGAVRYIHAYMEHNEPGDSKLVFQQANQAKGKGAFWTEDKLRRVGLWKPGEPHAMDALRHVLYYRTFTLGDQTLLEKLK